MKRALLLSSFLNLLRGRRQREREGERGREREPEIVLLLDATWEEAA